MTDQMDRKRSSMETFPPAPQDPVVEAAAPQEGGPAAMAGTGTGEKPVEAGAEDVSSETGAVQEMSFEAGAAQETSFEAGAEEADAMESAAEYDQASLFDTSDEKLMAAIEAILFAMGESVEITAIAKALNVRESRVRRGVALLQERCASDTSGITVRLFDHAVQMSTKAEQYENLIKIAKVPKKATLSEAVIETLSIIAYRQPVTRLEIEDVRGVSCDYAINRLLEYDLIREVGRRDVPGRPILFGTTEQFLRSFGLKDLSELPSVDKAAEEELRKEAEAEVDSRLGI